MFNIRSNTFETNSSSSHSLCIAKNSSKYDEELLEKEYSIVPFTQAEIVGEEYYFTKIEDKLRYLYTAYIQNEYNSSNNWEDHPLCKNLHVLMPNLHFIPYNGDYIYVFEDVEWFFYEDEYNQEESEWEIFKDINKLKKFLLEGVIYFFNRDNEDQNNRYNNLDKEIIFCEWTG